MQPKPDSRAKTGPMPGDFYGIAANTVGPVTQPPVGPEVDISYGSTKRVNIRTGAPRTPVQESFTGKSY